MSEPISSVMFVCVHNAGRSQMAAGYLSHLAGDRVEVRSSGTMPADKVNPAVVEAMLEEGIDISSNTPKVLTDEDVKARPFSVQLHCESTSFRHSTFFILFFHFFPNLSACIRCHRYLTPSQLATLVFNQY